MDPSLNDPAAQEAFRRQKEAERQAAADQAARTVTPRSTGTVGDTVMNGISDFGEGVGNAVSDMFSAETVSGPSGGQWGQSGTAAAGYNAGAAARGQGLNASATGQGNAIAAGNANTAAGLQGRGQQGQQREAPTTNFAGANLYDSLGQSQRNVANDYASRAADASKQQAQLAALNQFARGPEGPSAAQAQLAASSDAAQRGALSMARSGRGAGESASAMRDAMFSNATTQGTIAGQSAQVRAQESATQRQQQLQALEAAMGGAGAIRGADATAAQLAQGTRAQDLASQAQLAGQAQFNTGVGMQQRGMNDAYELGLTNAGLGYNQLGQQGQLGFAQLGQQGEIAYGQMGLNALNQQADYELQQQQMALDAQKANQSADLEKDSGIVGMAGSAIGGLFSLSDERMKKNKSREKALSAALETVGNAPGYSYDYKDPKQPGAKAGRQYGPMAQDLERGPLGDTLVKDTPNGKMVDTGRVAMMSASAITELNQRLKALESAMGEGR